MVVIRKLTLLVLCVTLVVGLAGCGPKPTPEPAPSPAPAPAPAPQESKREPVTFRWAVIEGPDTIDPATLYGNRSIEVAQNLYDGLTDLDDGMNIVPAIAKEWTVSPDALTWTFTLRDDVYFSNGDQVTAEDFVWSWNRALWPETGNKHLFMMNMIKGYDAVQKGETREAEGLRAVDKLTFEVTLEFPASFFLSLSTRWPYWVVHRETVEKYGDKWTDPENFVSTGAYVVEYVDLDQRIVLVANDNHFRGRPAIDRVEIEVTPEGIMRMMKFEAGEIDAFSNLVPADLRRVQADPNLSPMLGTRSAMTNLWLAIFTQKPPFDNLKLRQALQYAIDKEKLIETAVEGMGTPAYTFLPPGMPAYDPTFKPYHYDPARGRELLAEAGYPGGKGLPPLEIAFPASDDNQKIFEFVQAEFHDNLGLNVTLQSLPPAAFREVRNDREKRPYLFRNGMGADYPDPQEFLEYFGHSAGFHNFEEYRNTKFDEYVDAANAHTDQKERMRLYDLAHRLYMEDATIVPLFHPMNTFMCSPEFKGFDYTELYVKQLRYVDVAN